MTSEGGLKVDQPENLEQLQKEAEALKSRLEEERQKLNDIPCKNIMLNINNYHMQKSKLWVCLR